MNSIQPITYNDQRLLTTQQLAESFDTDTKTLARNFQRNVERYHQGKHYFALTGEQLREFKGSRQFDDNLKFTSILYLWTEKGAWMLAKSLNNDVAWDAYETLVDDYYRVQAQVKVLSPEEQLLANMELTIKHSKKLTDVENEIKVLTDKVDNQITLDHGEQRRLQKGVAKRVYALTSCEEDRRKLFRELHREIKDRFAVGSYKDLKRKDLLKAINYIDNWVPRQVS
ncbi:ORF6N domain-containing protein [Jeotgalibacillus malaysiensis]|uniref:ORF6N domain-containing protein n=1 Tax=Jeotgalibacillus malaysiensis TaxID=1508404 RepID=UPI00384AB8B5